MAAVSNALFASHISQGRVSGPENWPDLVRACPKQFRDFDNPWTGCAVRIRERFRHHVARDLRQLIKTDQWKWKSGDEEEKLHQLDHFDAMLFAASPAYCDAMPVAGWMLSEMLEEVPAMSEL